MRHFTSYELPAETARLRHDVRAFLADTIPDLPAIQRARSWWGYDREFSKKLGARGWIGMTWPKAYGGQALSYLERYVVTEEMLAAGAPVGAHWIADRQSGPLLLKFGTEEQRRTILPAIARGELTFCIGMSEPGAGSDLAAVRTRARRADGGWRVSGQKIWTSNAHHADYMIALVRTSDSEQRHAGLSQLLIDMKSPGLTVRGITNLIGERDFNEVFFDDVFVADSALIGQEGEGWKQVVAELAYERSGPERYLSSITVFSEFLRAVGENPSEAERLLIGRITAEMWTLRQMSLGVTGKLAAGEDPAADAAIVKDLGTVFEQEIPRAIHAALRDGWHGGGDTPLEQALGYLLQSAPSFSLRGGTREILRGIIARELGLR